jgi:hypothetical protein
LRDQDDDLRATLVALHKLGQLYPDTFRMLLLAAREALRPMDTETRLDGHTSANAELRICTAGPQIAGITLSHPGS